MIRQDYILRMIEELRRVLAAIVALKAERRWPEVDATLDEQFRRLVGSGASDAVQLTSTDLLARLMEGASTQVVRDKIFILIVLFQEAGDAATAQDRLEQGRSFYLKGLDLLLEVLAVGEPADGPDFVPGLEVFVAAVKAAPLPPRTQAMLMQHYERTGAFAKAEDALFALLDLEPGLPGVVEFGTAFYERLQGQSDTALIAGNLPRPELVAGLAELHSRKSRTSPASG